VVLRTLRLLGIKTCELIEGLGGWFHVGLMELSWPNRNCLSIQRWTINQKKILPKKEGKINTLDRSVRGGTLLVAQWLRHCATNRKVAGSIPDGVTGTFITCNIQKFRVQATIHWCVLCGSQNKHRLFPPTPLTDWCLWQRFNPLPYSGHYMYRQFNIQQFYVLLILCIYVFCVDLRTNSDYFLKQH
jgi:hypothetical protein